jgi:Zn-dependent protease with chaperone function
MARSLRAPLPARCARTFRRWGIQMDRDVYLATMISLATAAFGVVAALAWNSFITALVTQVLGEQGGLTGLFIYAVVITILAVVVITWLGRLAERRSAKSAI